MDFDGLGLFSGAASLTARQIRNGICAKPAPFGAVGLAWHQAADPSNFPSTPLGSSSSGSSFSIPTIQMWNWMKKNPETLN
jgi:hypothetical protein